jgi:hypothetical protein
MPDPTIRAAWLAQLHSTLPADRPRAEVAVSRLYTAAGFPEPRSLLWFDSPCAASWPIALLVAEGNRVWAPLLAPSALSREDRDRMERTRTELAQRLGVPSWKEVVQAFGRPRIGTLQMMPDPALMFSAAMLDFRFKLVDDVTELFAVPDESDDLARAEQYLHGGNRGVLTSALHCSTTGSIIGNSFFSEYTFSSIAQDKSRVRDRPVPAILDAAWDTARSTGLFWPFERAVFLSDRPVEIHVNDRHLPHNDAGPAIRYRDGWRVFAWNGKAVPERWIMQPESVPPREYKGFDSSYGKFAASRAQPVAKFAKRKPVDSIMAKLLPSDHAQRLADLRAHAGGRLPLLDRYLAGDHRAVWTELVSLGSAVREEPLSADALAVAYETMHRVAQNVRTLVERLKGIGYKFAEGSRAHVPPTRDAAKLVSVFEKEFGVLPLSLRAFHEVVGEVSFIGKHPDIDPRGNPVAPDPLVVYALDEGAVEFDDEDEDETPAAIVIAPDDLHKADTSGGDPYEMAIPDLRADGELVNERHELFFVDYLRLAFQYGGFPGYEGRSVVPAELQQLASGLIEF